MSEAEKSGNTLPEGSTAFRRKKRILLAQDDVRSRYMLLDQLNKQGCEVDVAANGAIALKKAGAAQFDAVILDIMLHGMKGVDLIKQLRAKKGSEEMPVFVCTNAARMDAWRRRGTKPGATKVFDKGATAPDVIAKEIVAALVQASAPATPSAPPPIDNPE